MEIIKDIFNRFSHIFVILVIFILIVLGIWGIIVLLDKIQLERYNTFQENVQTVINKVKEMNDLGEVYLGTIFTSTTEYESVIKEIKQVFEIDIVKEQYYLLQDSDKIEMGIEQLKSQYVVNYEKGIVFCLQPVKYNKIKYYTSLEMQKRLQNQYSYDLPVIPNNFNYKMGNWDTGYVIQDSLQNEFVWIPVGMLNKQHPAEAFRKYYIEREKVTEQTDEYTNILNSINKYGGFYIARYEASLQGATEQSSSGNTNILASKQNVIPVSQVSFTTSNIEDTDSNRGYNIEGKSVEQGQRKGAIELAQSMANDYKWNEQGVHTTIMYAEHYDTILYIAEKLKLLQREDITNNSTFNGNYINSVYGYEKNGQFVQKYKEQGILLPTGTNLYDLKSRVVNKIFNIYDLAGNLVEWTMHKNQDNYIVRGGSYSSNGYQTNMSQYVSQDKGYSSANLGIRVVMYID